MIAAFRSDPVGVFKTCVERAGTDLGELLVPVMDEDYTVDIREFKTIIKVQNTAIPSNNYPTLVKKIICYGYLYKDCVWKRNSVQVASAVDAVFNLVHISNLNKHFYEMIIIII